MDVNRISTNQKHKHHHHSQVSLLPFSILNSSVNGFFIFCLALYSQLTARSKKEKHHRSVGHLRCYSPQPQFCKQFCFLEKEGFTLSQHKGLHSSSYFQFISVLLLPKSHYAWHLKPACLLLLFLSSHFPLVFNSRSPVQSIGKLG